LASSLLSTWIVLKDVDLETLKSALEDIDFAIIIFSVVTVLLTTVAKSLRWRLLLGRSHELTRNRAVSLLVINHTVNNIFPWRFGEIARAYLAADKDKVPVVVSLGSIVLEKSIDTLIMLASLAVVLPLIAMPVWLWQAALGTGAIAVLFVLAAPIAIRKPEAILRWLGRTKSIVPMRLALLIERQIYSLLDSISEVGSRRRLAELIGWSTIIWMLSVATNQTVFIAMGYDVPLLASVFLLNILQIGVAIPSAPGRIGLFQATAVFGLSFFSLESTMALAYSLVLYVVVFVPLSCFGAWLLFREQTNLLRYLRPRKNSVLLAETEEPPVQIRMEQKR
jgi:uncharacterized protein (TIRG00374 family)